MTLAEDQDSRSLAELLVASSAICYSKTRWTKWLIFGFIKPASVLMLGEKCDGFTKHDYILRHLPSSSANSDQGSLAKL